MDDLLKIVIGSVLSSLGVGTALIVVLKKLVEGKIENAYTIQLEKARQALQRQNELATKRLEAYGMYLSSAYRCRNFTRAFAHIHRTNWLYEIMGRPSTNESRHEEVHEQHDVFLWNLNRLEEILYEYRLYFQHDSFEPLHMFKRESVRFRLALDEAVQRAQAMTLDDARKNGEIQACLERLSHLAVRYSRFPDQILNSLR